MGFGYGITEPQKYVEESETEFPETEGDSGYRLFIGNAISERFAAEISHLDFGTYEVGTLDGDEDPNVFEDTLSITGIDVSVVGKWNWTKYFSVFAKTGLFYWRGERYVYEQKPNADDELVEQETTLVTDDLSTSIGFGFDYRVYKGIGVQLEANTYGTADIGNQFYGLSIYYSL